MLARNAMRYATDKVFKKETWFTLSKLKIVTFKAEVIFGKWKNMFEDFQHQAYPTEKII